MVTTETEEKILIAARNVFIKRGFDGARMQEIADESGINKALLHYYFRNKSKLFEKIYLECLQKFFSGLWQILNSEFAFNDKISSVVDYYTKFLYENPFLPQFIIVESNRNPDKMKEFLSRWWEDKIEEQKFAKEYELLVREGKFIDMDFVQFFSSMIALCIFPTIAKNMLQIIFKMNDNNYHNFLEVRKEQITKFIINGITKQ